MHEPDTSQLERSPTIARLAPQATRVVPAPHCRGAWRQRRSREPVDDLRPGGRPAGPTAPSSTRSAATVSSRTARSAAQPPRAWPRSRWLPRPALDPGPDCGGDSAGVRRVVSSASCRSLVQGHSLESAKAGAPSPPARRSGHGPVARRYLARHSKGADAQQQTILFLDESGLYPLPSVVRT
jgi:hypothetical protein